MKNKLQNWSRYLVTLIVMVGFGLRLWRINYPLMDWQSFRQADTASVTWEFVKHNYPIWLPHYHDLGKIQSGMENLEGYRMVEFPIVNYVLALMMRLGHTQAVELWSRLASVLASTGSIVLLYLFLQKALVDVSKETAEKISLAAAAVLAILPYSIYYGRAVLPEPFQVFFGLLSLWALTVYLDKRSWQWWLLTSVSLMLALLLKPTTIFWGPVWLWLAWYHEGAKCFQQKDLWVLAVVAVLPLIGWRVYIQQFPSGIPANAWLLNGPIHGTPPRWRPMWWRWLFYERLIKLWLGYGGAVFAALGLFPFTWRLKEKIKLTAGDWLLYWWLFGDFAYLSVFATGNVQHDYYQYILLPAVALLLARGMYKFYELMRHFISYLSIKNKLHFLPEFLLILLVGGGWYLAWNQVKGFFNVNNWNQVRLGVKAQEILPEEALVIADSKTGDTNFLFQTRHRGWPDSLELESYIEQGAQYLLATDTDDFYHYLLAHYSLVYQDEDGYIFNLQVPVATASSSIME